MILAAAQDDESRLEEGSPEPQSSPSGKIITEQHVLETSGDRRLESVRLLVMREMQLISFEPTCISRLQNLTVLSLSNNSLRNLEGFQSLVSLVELNLNFNNVTSLDGLCCTQLQKLFLSNNLIGNLATLKSFPRLQTLCLFKNIIPDLSNALESLRGLAGLRELDLVGNPCAQSRGYRHRVIRSCPRLRELDGEEITRLDRELSILFFEEQEKGALWRRGEAFRVETGSNGCPASFPRASSRLVDKTGSAGMATEVERPGERVSENRGTLSSRLPLNKARLFASDRLNNDPQLLAYLVQGVLADPSGSPRDVIDSLRQRHASLSEDGRYSSGVTTDQSAFTMKVSKKTSDEKEKKQGRRNIPSEKIKSSSIRASAGYIAPCNPTNILEVKEWSDQGPPREEERICFLQREVTADAGGSSYDFACLSRDDRLVDETAGSFDAADLILTEDQPVQCEAVDGDGEGLGRDTAVVDRREEALRSGRSSNPPLPLPPQARSLSALVDPSDPHATIRKLLKVIEALQIERRLDGHQDGVVGGGFLRGEAQDIGANDDAEYSREDIRRLRLENRNMQLLLVENRELKRQAKEDAARGKEKQRALTAEVESLRGQLRGISATAAERDKWQHDRDGRSSSDHEAACEATNDNELEELFRRNERTMRQIRRDLWLAQRETFGEPMPMSTDQISGPGERLVGSSSIMHDSNLDWGKLGGEPRGYFMPQPRRSSAFDTPTVEEKEGIIWRSDNGEQKFVIETSGRGRDTSETVVPRDSLTRLESSRIVSADDGDKGRMGSFTEREIDCLADGFKELESCTSCYRMPSFPHRICLPVFGEKLSTPEVNSSRNSSISSVTSSDDLEAGNKTGTAARYRPDGHVTKSDGNQLCTAATDPEVAVKTFKRNKSTNDGPRGRSSPVPWEVDEGCGKPGGSVTIVAPNVRDILVSEELE